MGAKRTKQGELPFGGRGGKRPGAGRKPSGLRQRVGHARRPAHTWDHPLHVTLRLKHGLPSLRSARAQEVLRGVLLASRERFGLRLVHFSAQSNHLHLVCEAEDEAALTRGMKGLNVRLARALNGIWSRKGKIFEDRFHSRSLRSPREVRHVLAYVFGNARHHGVRFTGDFDPCSSAEYFEGWDGPRSPPEMPGWLVEARTWLLTRGWKKGGLLPVHGAHGRGVPEPSREPRVCSPPSSRTKASRELSDPRAPSHV